MSDEEDPIAALDQAMRALVDTARVLFAHFSALKEQGFTDDQALALTVAFQTAIQNSAPRD